MWPAARHNGCPISGDNIGSCPEHGLIHACICAAGGVMPAKTSGWILALIISASGARASFAQATSASMGGEVVSDFKYMSNNVLLDAEDIATSPLYVGSPDS